MRSLVLAFLTFVISSFSGLWAPERHACELARRGQAEVQALIESDFAPAACRAILDEAASLPAGARELRETADRSVPGASSRCLEPVNSIRYLCAGERCLPQSYLFCAQWSYSLVEDPRYELAHGLAHLLDVLHDREQAICGASLRGQPDFRARADFTAWMRQVLAPASERLADRACGA